MHKKCLFGGALVFAGCASPVVAGAQFEVRTNAYSSSYDAFMQAGGFDDHVSGGLSVSVSEIAYAPNTFATANGYMTAYANAISSFQSNLIFAETFSANGESYAFAYGTGAFGVTETTDLRVTWDMNDVSRGGVNVLEQGGSFLLAQGIETAGVFEFTAFAATDYRFSFDFSVFGQPVGLPPIYGFFQIEIIPSPPTVAMVSAGALVAARRRR